VSTKEEVTIEVVRGANPLAPPRSSAPSEDLVDQFMEVLTRESAPEPEPGPTPEELLDLGFEHNDPTGLVRAPALPDSAPPVADDSHVRFQVSSAAMALAQADADEEAATPPSAEPATEPAQAEPAAASAEPAQGRAKRDSIRPDHKKRAPRNVQERIRGLTAAEQQKLARMGEQRERVVLERMYGKNVWESLLRNPKLTPPEAARIARMGALPLPLLEMIVGNRSWLSSPQVRRALLSNPRLKKDMVSTVLRATPKNELKLMPKQMAYPVTVRQAAQKMLT
jgi:hypothetical protein